MTVITPGSICATDNNPVTLHHIFGTEGILIQNDGKQDVFQQCQGWIQLGAASLAPHVLRHNTLGGVHAESLQNPQEKP